MMPVQHHAALHRSAGALGFAPPCRLGRTHSCGEALVDLPMAETRRAGDLTWAPYPTLGIIDEEKKVRHAKFTAKLEEAITDPAKLGIKLRADNVDIAYPPIVQSGGVYDLRASAQSDDRHLQYDVITASIGASSNQIIKQAFIL